MTTNKPSLNKLSTAMALRSLPPLEPPSPPHFPTLEEVVQLAAEEKPPQRQRLLGLFDGLLGDPIHMLEDFSRHPEKYGSESHELLGQLLSGSTSLKQLSDAERRILDLATFDYLQNPQPKTKQAQALKPPSSSVKTPKELQKELERQKPRPGVDVPVTELPAYWWL